MFVDSTFSNYIVAFMMDVVILAGIPLAVATGCGLIVSFFQAVTQIQDQTFSLTVKIVAITITLLSFGAVLSRPLMTLTQEVFDNFNLIVL